MKKTTPQTDTVSIRVARAMMLDAGTTVGSFHQAIGGNDRGFVQWLLREIPENVTIAEFLVQIAIDAYNEEKDE